MRKKCKLLLDASFMSMIQPLNCLVGRSIYLKCKLCRFNSHFRRSMRMTTFGRICILFAFMIAQIKHVSVAIQYTTVSWATIYVSWGQGRAG